MQLIYKLDRRINSFLREGLVAGPLVRAFEEFRDYGQDLARSTYQTVDNSLRRFVSKMDSEPIASVLASALPPVDFDSWYTAAQATVGSMVGSGELDWPVDASQRVALQAELLRRLAAENPNLLMFCYEFCYASTYHNDNIRLFAEQILSPFRRDLLRLVRPALDAEDSAEAAAARRDPSGPAVGPFIDPSRLAELRSVSSRKFDLRRLIRLCEELDGCYQAGFFLSVAALTRALLDHVPPIFGCSRFAEVANNYAGARSFRESMLHLENSARRIGDAHLHIQIRPSETLPTATQVNFQNDLDVLLAEIVRILGEAAV